MNPDHEYGCVCQRCADVRIGMAVMDRATMRKNGTFSFVTSKPEIPQSVAFYCRTPSTEDDYSEDSLP